MDVPADHAVDVALVRLAASASSNLPMKFTAFLTLSFAQRESDQ